MARTKYTGVSKDPKTGKYMYYFKSGVDAATGKPYQERRRGFDTAKEAFEARTLAMQKIQSIGKIKHTQMTFSDFMDRIFLPDYYNRTSIDIHDRYGNIFKELKKVFGSKKPRDITVFDVTMYKNDILSKHSSSYARMKLSTLKQIMKMAYSHGLLPKGLVTDHVANIPITQKEVDFWTKEEFEEVIDSLDLRSYFEHFIFTLLWLYYFTGMRVGEGGALYWDNIDFEKKQITIRYNLQYINRQNWLRVDQLKTKNSRRIIGIDDTTIEVLKEWKKRQGECVKTDFVLSPDGNPYPKRSIRDQIIKYAKRAGVKYIQPKGLRHSHASLLINEYNTNILSIQKRLGHAKVDMTLRVYSHLYPNADEIITSQLSNLFDKKLPKMATKNNGKR